jgi:hypothetical protein
MFAFSIIPLLWFKTVVWYSGEIRDGPKTLGGEAADHIAEAMSDVAGAVANIQSPVASIALAVGEVGEVDAAVAEENRSHVELLLGRHLAYSQTQSRCLPLPGPLWVNRLSRYIS